ncbi:MAG: Flagellar basal-body rod protein FlgG [Alphaproteobacteria bacterium MarineAlpha9_Bin4]|nr:MAG: Flagellar basal-body rod protein FlgG [Alphaproteobacteria bacterium MarineAlpha9_Bin4]|tara:strand:- start:128 stop:937 length:810 start_codon:yes stop_codon:yes gene_type:complete
MFNITRNGLDAISKELGVISNNIANANTTAFKKSRTEFVDLYSKALSSNPKAKTGLGTVLQGTQKIMKQGSPILTDSALDLSVSGKGFFILSPKEGADPRFTRDGSFSLNAQGNLITTEGFNVAGYAIDEAGNRNFSAAVPLKVPLSIESDGKVLLLSGLNVNNRGVIETTYGLNTIIERGQIALAKFNNEIELKSKGANTYQATQKSGEQILGTAMSSNFGEILSGALESSNTNISGEMINLIKTQQAFNGNARILQSNVEVTRRLMG